jgi:ABC-type Fe3+/spermidine/putrescine transport system ATPase subunit
MVRLTGFGSRMPQELSGGQRQRVAMARALVSRPRLILMDEPLGALDKALRDELVVELKTLHRDLGSTFICVTHDQSEAMAMSDVVAVMRAGSIVQAGSPTSLWRDPETAFVAEFLGGGNLLPISDIGLSDPGFVVVRVGDFTLKARATRPHPQSPSALRLMIRPEHLWIGQLDRQSNQDMFTGRLRESVFLGDLCKVVFDVLDGTVTARLSPEMLIGVERGALVGLCFDPKNARLVLAEGAS